MLQFLSGVDGEDVVVLLLHMFSYPIFMGGEGGRFECEEEGLGVSLKFPALCAAPEWHVGRSFSVRPSANAAPGSAPCVDYEHLGTSFRCSMHCESPWKLHPLDDISQCLNMVLKSRNKFCSSQLCAAFFLLPASRGTPATTPQ